jgi:hypothetical protein
MGTVLHLNRTGPTVTSDAGLITRVGFASLPKFYTNNSSIIQKLVYYYWFPILCKRWGSTPKKSHLHWNHYLCSSALSHWLATVSPLTVLGTSSRFLCSWSYPFLSLFLEMMATLDVWMDVLVLVCSKLTLKLTLWSQADVLIWRC